VAKGIPEAEHSDLQRLWGCNRLDSAILQKGSEASPRFFEVGGCPSRTGSNPIFFIKIIQRPEDSTSAFHQVLIKKRK
jgi:hypothetical protein